MTFDISSIVGSIILGYLFGKVHIKGFLLAPLMVILIICFYPLKYLSVSVS
jgi:hypothetical protein